MVKKDKKAKVAQDLEEPPYDEEVYTLSGDEHENIDKSIVDRMNFKEHIVYCDDFNVSLDKIKALKELLSEENTTEKPTQLIIDALAEKISEMIKELK